MHSTPYPLITFSYQHDGEDGTAFILPFTVGLDDPNGYNGFHLTLATSFGAFANTWRNIGKRDFKAFLQDLTRDTVIEKLMKRSHSHEFSSTAFFRVVEERMVLNAQPPLSDEDRLAWLEQLHEIRDSVEDSLSPRESVDRLSAEGDFPELGRFLEETLGDLSELVPLAYVETASTAGFMDYGWPAFIEALAAYDTSTNSASFVQPEVGALTIAEIRELAVKAGIRVWKDGSMTAADPVGGVPHSGAATLCIPKLVRLVEERYATSRNSKTAG